MFTFIRERKYNYLIVILVFIIGVSIKWENLKAPLVRHQEWISAHTLITAEIWENNGGPNYSGFSPVYTYPEKANFGRKMLGGVTNSKGHHYVSYPPFSFIAAYYGMEVLGGVNPANLRIISLLCLLVSSFLLLEFLLSIFGIKPLSIPGIIGVLIFNFSTGNLLYFGHLYFSDVLIIPLVLLFLLLLQRYFKRNYNTKFSLLMGLFFIGFLMVYTEWLGLFMLFISGIFCLIQFIRHRNKLDIQVFLTFFFAGISSLTLTIFQYSQIKGWEALKLAWVNKFAVRSGHAIIDNPQNSEYNLFGNESYNLLWNHLRADLLGIIEYLYILFPLFFALLLIKNFRQNIYQFFTRTKAFSIIALAVLMHYLVFFNFNVVHTFSSIKLVLILAFLIGVIIGIIKESWPWPYTGIPIALLSTLLLLFLYQDIQRYKKNINSYTLDTNLYSSRQLIGNELENDRYILTNLPNCPEQVYVIKQDVFPAENLEKVKKLMINFHLEKAVYYASENHIIHTRYNLQKNEKDSIQFQVHHY